MKQETLRTFDEWNAAGFIIKKGEKMCGRNEQGKPLFNENQVQYIELDFEEEMDLADFYRSF